MNELILRHVGNSADYGIFRKGQSKAIATFPTWHAANNAFHAMNAPDDFDPDSEIDLRRAEAGLIDNSAYANAPCPASDWAFGEYGRVF